LRRHILTYFLCKKELKFLFFAAEGGLNSEAADGKEKGAERMARKLKIHILHEFPLKDFASR
jgi:hypothetical protein